MAEGAPPEGLADVLLADRYRVGRRLGDGPAGHVYAADDVLLGRPVAVKVLDGLDDEVAAGRALRAARAVARVRHDALVAVVDVDHGRPSFLALERVEGGSLEDVLADGPVARPGPRRGRRTCWGRWPPSTTSARCTATSARTTCW